MMLRSFVAIEIPKELQEAMDKSTANLKKALARPLVRWVPMHNVHLTMKFLGDVSSTNLELLAQTLKVEAEHHTAFTLSIGGLGVYPNPRHPRVVWIGIEAPDSLQALHRGIEMAAAHLGFEPEKRRFSPHLTIGRINQNASTGEVQQIRTALEQIKVGFLGTVTVDAVHIFKSDLQPGGAIYTHLHRAALLGIQ